MNDLSLFHLKLYLNIAFSFFYTLIQLTDILYLILYFSDPDLFVYCCDFSPVAIDLVKSHPDYNAARCHGFVFDITDTEAILPFPEGSLNIIILIFVLSAVHPEKYVTIFWQNKLVNWSCSKGFEQSTGAEASMPQVNMSKLYEL